MISLYGREILTLPLAFSFDRAYVPFGRLGSKVTLFPQHLLGKGPLTFLEADTFFDETDLYLHTYSLSISRLKRNKTLE